MLKTRLVLSLVLGAALLVTACGDGGRAPAEAALATAQSAFDAAKAGAATYVPDQVKAVEDDLAAARATFDRGEFAQALNEAQALPADISALTAAATARKAELTAEWTALSTTVPSAVGAIQGHLDGLSKMRRLPAGTTAETVTAARSGLDTMNTTWNDAQAAFKADNPTEAVAKGEMVKTSAAQVMASLGLQVPDTLK